MCFFHRHSPNPPPPAPYLTILRTNSQFPHQFPTPPDSVPAQRQNGGPRDPAHPRLHRPLRARVLRTQPPPLLGAENTAPGGPGERSHELPDGARLLPDAVSDEVLDEPQDPEAGPGLEVEPNLGLEI